MMCLADRLAVERGGRGPSTNRKSSLNGTALLNPLAISIVTETAQFVGEKREKIRKVAGREEPVEPAEGLHHNPKRQRGKEAKVGWGPR
jgi:hypothetical protein